MLIQERGSLNVGFKPCWSAVRRIGRVFVLGGRVGGAGADCRAIGSESALFGGGAPCRVRWRIVGDNFWLIGLGGNPRSTVDDKNLLICGRSTILQAHLPRIGQFLLPIPSTTTHTATLGQYLLPMLCWPLERYPIHSLKTHFFRYLPSS